MPGPTWLTNTLCQLAGIHIPTWRFVNPRNVWHARVLGIYLYCITRYALYDNNNTLYDTKSFIASLCIQLIFQCEFYCFAIYTTKATPNVGCYCITLLSCCRHFVTKLIRHKIQKEGGIGIHPNQASSSKKSTFTIAHI